MERYFFHRRDGEEFVPDEVGMDLPSLAEAHREAVRGARDILVDQLRAGEALDGQRIRDHKRQRADPRNGDVQEALRLDATIH